VPRGFFFFEQRDSGRASKIVTLAGWRPASKFQATNAAAAAERFDVTLVYIAEAFTPGDSKWIGIELKETGSR
jgi:hypothetical protein